MALSLSDFPPDVSPPLNPTPVITSSPAATIPCSSPRTSVSTPSLSSLDPSSPARMVVPSRIVGVTPARFLRTTSGRLLPSWKSSYRTRVRLPQATVPRQARQRVPLRQVSRRARQRAPRRRVPRRTRLWAPCLLVPRRTGHLLAR